MAGPIMVGGKPVSPQANITVDVGGRTATRSTDLHSIALMMRDDHGWETYCETVTAIRRRKALEEAGAVECEQCSALVFDVVQHRRWHGGFGEARGD